MQAQRATRLTYAGLFLIALATLMYEILLTRIFSVTMWYHFAFVAVSIAMFGMTVGAAAVFVLPRGFPEHRTRSQLATFSLLFALTMIGSFVGHLWIPFDPGASGSGLLILIATYALISVPFIFGGIVVSLALTRFPRQISRLYSADLAGAALGCVALIGLLSILNGPSAVFVVASLAMLGAAAFALDARRVGLGAFAFISCALLLSFGWLNSRSASDPRGLLHLQWVKGGQEKPALYEKWNSFSRIRVEGDPNLATPPMGWGMSPAYPPDRRFNQLYLNIDATAGTYLTRFNGDTSDVDFVKFDVTNLAHWILKDANVLIVGTGGGRDVLSALAFDQKHITGVEINGQIVDAVNRVFGDFTGHLDRNPRVTIVNDEARSFIARSGEKYDLIQISLIDTWAATAAGAFVLSENSLYTTEAWQNFLTHLSDRGILTVSRWYHKGVPGETYRMVGLANASLRAMGVSDPRRHIVIALRSQHRESGGYAPDGVATMLVSREPFSDQSLEELKRVTERMQFGLVLTPITASDDVLAQFASVNDVDALAAQFPINLAPPTDNQPFFFNMARLRDMLHPEKWNQAGISFNLRAVRVLGGLLAFVIVLTIITVVVPVLLRSDRTMIRSSIGLSIYFAAIGMGFMLIEISQMQRLIIMLGHPTYSLSVVLFTLLLASGVGSFSTQGIDVTSRGAASIRFALLLAVLIVVGLITPHITVALAASHTPVRILAAVATLFPVGLVLGAAFPIGIKSADDSRRAITPWLWAINGATSVCASVLSVVLAMAWGIQFAWWTGVGCYVVAMMAIALDSQSRITGNRIVAPKEAGLVR